MGIEGGASAGFVAGRLGSAGLSGLAQGSEGQGRRYAVRQPASVAVAEKRKMGWAIALLQRTSQAAWFPAIDGSQIF